jgi:hypothetical protein
MFRHRNRIGLFAALIIVGIISALVARPILHSLSDHLSKTTRVKAEIMVVEGWLPPYAIKMAYEEFKTNKYNYVVSTGILNTSEYFNLYSNGSLIFYSNAFCKSETEVSTHTIEINAFSSLAGKDCARFNVLINDSLIQMFSAIKRKKKYSIEWYGSLADVDSISVQFVNDMVTVNKDRDLFVKEIILDNKIYIPYQLNSVYDITGRNGKHRIKNNYKSYANLAKNKLLALGIDSTQIIDISGEKVTINRTLTSALAFRDWLKSSNKEVNGINIVTLGTHARRTWMIYNRIFENEYKIGIISVPDNREHNSRRYKVLKTLRETLGIIYYWFILIPY